MPANVIKVLRERGFINTAEDGRESITDPEIERRAEEAVLTCYAGFDPTARSLHVGHLVVVMGLAYFQRSGHRPIAVVGGGTGMIGDPSGKSTERPLLSPEAVKENIAGLRGQLERFLEFGSGDTPEGQVPKGSDRTWGAGGTSGSAQAAQTSAMIVDNAEWLMPFRFVDFLREVGRHFRLGEMLARDSVKARLASPEGMSFTEFAYQMCQAYDFLHLHDEYGCDVQIGGRDQWGNITAGADLVRRVRGATVCGIVLPLLETATGEKFGKTAGNAVWLDPGLTSPYQFYQFWIRTDDRDLERYFKLFTFLDIETINETCRSHESAPEKRSGQRALASEVTRMVHGEEALAQAERASEVLFGGEVAGLSDAELREIFGDVPSAELPMARLAEGFPLAACLVEAGVARSKGEARRLVESGGVYLNNARATDAATVLTPANLASEHILVIRKGKKSYHLVRFG